MAWTSPAQFPIAFSKISATQGDFTGSLSFDAKFGIKADAIGDINNDGITDVAIGATNQGGSLRGSAFVLLLKSNGKVLTTVEIPSPEPGDLDSFGSAVAGLGDLDGDGVEDIAVGAGYDSEDGNQIGAIYILFLNSNGTVKATQKINNVRGNFFGSVSPGGNFGTGMAGLGDLDGDGVPDLAVGADLDMGTGSVFILFLNANGTVKSHTKIANAQGGFPSLLNFEDYFGYGLGRIGDLDGDGITDIVVGAHRTDIGGTNRGAIYILFLNTNGTVKNHTRISAAGGGFIESYTALGVSATGVTDIDNDGVRDIIVGSNDSNNDGGVLWYLLMNANGTVKAHHKISESAGSTNIALDPGDFFGCSTVYLGDINNDGIKDIGVGAFNDDDGGQDKGAFWISVLECSGISTAGNDQSICNVTQTGLGAGPSGMSGTWSLFQGSGQILSPTNPLTSVTNLGEGVNLFIWDLGPTACVRRDTVKVTRIYQPPANAGADLSVCVDTPATLSGNAGNNGIWTLYQGSGQITNPTLPTTTVTNIGLGQNRFIWTLGTNCTQKDTVSVNGASELIAAVAADSIYTCTEDANLQAVQPAAGKGTWSVVTGQASIQDQDNAMTGIQLVDRMPVVFSWKVTQDGCQPQEAFATVFPFDIVESDFPNVITPNGDGKNETWRILQTKPVTAFVRIFNRWGIMVYESPAYPNNWAGADLTEGVYFYRLSVEGCTEEIKGSVQIIR